MKIHFKNTHNPILPLEHHIPDSEGHVMPDGKLCIYGSYDERSDVYCSEKYHVVSTADMENWEIHDAALKGEEIPWFNNPETPKYPGIHPKARESLLAPEKPFMSIRLVKYMARLLSDQMETAVNISAAFQMVTKRYSVM